MHTQTNEISWLLFDADNTLLDFSGAAKEALWATFTQYDRSCDEQIYQIYQQVNKQVWDAFEQNQMDAITLRYRRFELLFEEIQEPGLPAKAFGKHFLDNLILKSEAYEGVLELMEQLKLSYKLSLVTNGLKEVQRPRLNRLNLSPYFDSIIVSDEIGVAKPHGDYFNAVYHSIPDPPHKSEVLIIGDSLTSDILGGRDFGIKTCWVNHGREHTGEIIPDYQISDISQLRAMLQKIAG